MAGILDRDRTPTRFHRERRFSFFGSPAIGFCCRNTALIFGILRDVTDGVCVKGIALQAGIAAAGQFL